MTMAVFVLLQILRTLDWSGTHQTAEQCVFRTPEELNRAWAADGGAPETLPKVDFEKEMVLAVFAGQKPTGGHAIKIERVAVKGPDADPTIYVLYRQTSPAPDSMVTQALTHPAHAVVLKKIPGRIRFLDSTSQEGGLIEKAISSATRNPGGQTR